MYCRCGSDKEMVDRQQQQEWQGLAETIYFLHCKQCGQNHLNKYEREKLEKQLRYCNI